MRSHIPQALERTQLIVPEIDLDVKWDGKDILQINPVPLESWHLYTYAIEGASDQLIDHMHDLPDLEMWEELHPLAKSLEEIEKIATDLNCLITSFNLFYEMTVKELNNILENVEEKEITQKDFQRIAKYRRFSSGWRKGDNK